jgi:hypothetical protein
VAYLSDQHDATVIHGDGGRRSVRKQAGLARSDVVASLTGYGAMTNVGICTMAREIDPEIGTVARIDHGDAAEYTGLVDRVVYPEQLAAHAATNEIMHVAGEGVQTVKEVTGDLAILELSVASDAPVAGRELSDAAFPRGVGRHRRAGQQPVAGATDGAGARLPLPRRRQDGCQRRGGSAVPRVTAGRRPGGLERPVGRRFICEPGTPPGGFLLVVSVKVKSVRVQSRRSSAMAA